MMETLDHFVHLFPAPGDGLRRWGYVGRLSVMALAALFGLGMLGLTVHPLYSSPADRQAQDNSPGSPAAVRCWATADDGSTVYASADAGAVQQAVDAAGLDDTVKVAGYCAGVQSRAGASQTVYINQALTLQGGYTYTHWTVYDPALYPTTLDAQSGGRVVYIAASGHVTVAGLVLVNGATYASSEKGAGVYNAASSSLRIVDSQIVSNTTHYYALGAGLYNPGGSVVISNSLIAYNQSGEGAGIYNHTGLLSITHSALYGNIAHTNGGGLYNRGVATLTHTSVASNTAGEGGGILNAAPGTPGVSLSVMDSSLHDNMASDSGGGLYVGSNCSTALHNVTLSGNRAGGEGGGVLAYSNITLENVTLSQNTAARGGGITADGDHVTVTLKRSLVADNVSLDYNDDIHIASGGSYTSTGYNLIGTQGNYAFTVAEGDLVGSDAAPIAPILGPLQDNGGPATGPLTPLWPGSGQAAWTQALLPGSPAIDASACGLAADQRGVSRPRWFDCDMGAYEYDGLAFVAAVDDALDVARNVPSPLPVLDNDDSLTPTLPISIESVGAPGYGTAAIQGDHIVYTPALDFLGPDELSYVITNGVLTDTGSVYIHVVVPYCQATPDDGATVFGALDATAVQWAVDAADPGDTVKVFGRCAGGAQGRTGVTQTVYVSQSLTIQGGYTYTDWLVSNPLSYPTTIDAQSAGRVVYIASGDVSLQDLTLSGGYASDGGGVYAAPGSVLSLQNSTLCYNESVSGSVSSAGASSISYTIIEYNTGPGLYNTGVLTLDTSMVLSNTGAGLLNAGYAPSDAAALVQASTLVYNGGAGLENEAVSGAAAAEIVNSTVAYNTGRGVDNTGGAVSLIHSTLAGNAAGGVANTGSLLASNSLIAQNDGGDCASSVNSLGHNLDGDNSCGLDHPTDYPASSLALGALQDNGGAVWTRALLAQQVSEPAIDGGDCYAGALSVDQRGVERPQWSQCDIGAYEYDGAALIARDDYFTPGSGATVVLTVLDNDFSLDSFVPPPAVTLITGPSHGDLTPLSTSGTFQYKSFTGFTGYDRFNYLITRDGFTATATVHISIYPDSTPAFDLALTWIASNDAAAIAPADVDNDGDLDVAIIDTSSGIVRMYTNQGRSLAGAPGWEAANSSGATQLAWGDVDMDGDLDLAVATTETNKLYFNQQGTLGSLPAWESAPAVSGGVVGGADIAWGDVNGDGWLDLVSSGAGGYRVYMNANGQLPAMPTYSLALDLYRLALGDMNGDGRLDLAAVHLAGELPTVEVFTNTGSAFTAAPAWRLALSDVGPSADARLAWGDMDRDGDLDLAIAHKESPVRVYANVNGILGSTPVWSWNPASGGLRATNLAWGDINGDGLLDLAVNALRTWMSGDNPSLHLIFVNQAGALGTTAGWMVEGGDGPSAFADINNDGAMDLLVSDDLIKLYVNNQPPAFQSLRTSLDAEFFWNGQLPQAWGDVDGDGDLDLAIGDSNGSRLYLNRKGQLQGSAAWVGPASVNSLAWGDVNGDGRLDLAVGRSGVNRLFLNTGSGLSATPAWVSSESLDSKDLAWGDVDGDGDLDLAVADSGTVKLYHNLDGTLSSSATWQSADSDTNWQLAWGDVDNDGDLDLAVAGAASTRLYLNSVGGLDANLAWQTDGASSLDWGDVDLDGDLDLAVGAGGPKRVYMNVDGMLQPTPAWTSLDMDRYNVGVNWVDVNGDGYMELLAVNRYTTLPPATSRLYINVGGVLQSTGRVNFTGAQLSGSLADVDNDGDTDLAFYNNIPNAVGDDGVSIYYNQSDKMGFAPLPNSGLGAAISLYSDAAATFNGQIAYALAPAAGYALAHVRDSAVIPITYSIPYALAQSALQVRGFYSLNGGGDWLPAVATSDTITTHVSLDGAPRVYRWDTFASGFLGQSDNVVFRIEVAPGGHGVYGVPLAQQRPYVATHTDPFRVRGTQVRVMRQDCTGFPPVCSIGPAPNALVYRLPVGQTGGGQVMADEAGVPLRTNAAGYLSGHGQIEVGDRLYAMLSITATDTYTIYHTSAAPNESGLDGQEVEGPGVQTLTVSADNPLLLFDLNVSLEWDAHQDAAYREQLAAYLQRASEYLYDFTDGQAGLGNVNVFQNADEWVTSHVVIQANNRLRPFAAQGGVVVTDTLDPQHNIVSDTIRYSPGQVVMGSTWNRYGNPGQSLGDDWAIILAHELGHYLFYHDDTYLGLDDDGFLIPISTCVGSAMGDLYSNPDNTEFVADPAAWQANCADTLANRTLERSEWETIRLWYPALSTPAATQAGPAAMPFDFTSIQVYSPYTPTNTLGDATFYIDYAGGGGASSEARAYLLVPPADGGTEEYQYVRNLGSPFGGQNRVIAHGARPGDRLCVFDRPRAQFGCETIVLGDDRLAMKQDETWNPIIQLRPVHSSTLTIELTNTVPITFPLRARLFPDLYEIAEDSSVSITLTLVGGVYTGTFSLGYPALSGNVQVWVDETFTETNPRRETMVAYSVGGNPGRSRGGGGRSRGGGGYARGGGGRSRGGGGYARGGGAPILSPDGQMIFFTENPTDYVTGTLFAIQGMAGLPALPPGRILVGQGYYLAASPNVTLPVGSVSIQYLSNDALVVGASEEDLLLYFWDGVGWSELDTRLNTTFNLATAPSEGEGVYALLASMRIPLSGPGWNLFAYTVHAAQPVTQALMSITGSYTTVYGYEPDDPAGDLWKLYDTRTPTWTIDLHQLEYGKGYWINVSKNITLHLSSMPYTARPVSSLMPEPPSTLYGIVNPFGFPEPGESGLTVTAWISQTLCGQGRAWQEGSQLVYVIDVHPDWAGAPGCGATGWPVKLYISGLPTMPQAIWDNSQPQEWPLAYDPSAVDLYSLRARGGVGWRGIAVAILLGCLVGILAWRKRGAWANFV